MKTREETMLLKFNQQTFSTYLLKVQLKNILRKIIIQRNHYSDDDLYRNKQYIQKKNIYYNYSKNLLTIEENFNQTLLIGVLTLPTYDKINENYDFSRKINNLVKKNNLSEFYKKQLKNDQSSKNTLYDYLHGTDFNQQSYHKISRFLTAHGVKLKFSTLEKIQTNINYYKAHVTKNVFLSSEYIQKEILNYDIYSFIDNHEISPVINGIAFNILSSQYDPLQTELHHCDPEYKKYIFNNIMDRHNKIVFISNQPLQKEQLTKQKLLKRYKELYIKYLHDSNDYKILYKNILNKIENNQYVTIQLKQDQYFDSYIYVDKKSVQ